MSKDICPGCGDSSKGTYIPSGTEAEMTHLALQLGVPLEKAWELKTCAGCGTRWIGDRTYGKEPLKSYTGKTNLDVMREVLHGERYKWGSEEK